MVITVRLFATLRENREKEMVMEISEGTSVENVVHMLKIPVDAVSIVMINGQRKKMDAVLAASDVLALFPPVGGG